MVKSHCHVRRIKQSHTLQDITQDWRTDSTVCLHTSEVSSCPIPWPSQSHRSTLILSLAVVSLYSVALLIRQQLHGKGTTKNCSSSKTSTSLKSKCRSMLCYVTLHFMCILVRYPPTFWHNAYLHFDWCWKSITLYYTLLAKDHTYSYMFIVPASGRASGTCRGPYDPWSVKVWLRRWGVEGPHSCCRWVRRTWRPRGASWTDEGGLDQPLEILVGSDVVETGNKLTASCHSELLKRARAKERPRLA